MIGIIGVNHVTASLEIREKLAFTEEESRCFLEKLKNFLPDTEAVLLSTCNRTELYFFRKDRMLKSLIKVLFL